jgi:hypothetical protein
MLRLFKLLLTGDWHLRKGEVLKRVIIQDEDDDNIGTIYHQCCNHCGKLKTFKAPNAII